MTRETLASLVNHMRPSLEASLRSAMKEITCSLVVLHSRTGIDCQLVMRSTPMYLLRWQFACLTLAVLWSKTVAFAVTPTSNSCNQGMMPVPCIDWCPRTCRTPQNPGHCYKKPVCLPGCDCPNGTWFDPRASYCVEEGYCKYQGD